MLPWQNREFSNILEYNDSNINNLRKLQVFNALYDDIRLLLSNTYFFTIDLHISGNFPYLYGNSNVSDKCPRSINSHQVPEPEQGFSTEVTGEKHQDYAKCCPEEFLEFDVSLLNIHEKINKFKVLFHDTKQSSLKG